MIFKHLFYVVMQMCCLDWVLLEIINFKDGVLSAF